MKILPRIIIFVFVPLMHVAAADDSLQAVSTAEKKYASLRMSLSSSFIVQENFNQEDIQNLVFLASADGYIKSLRPKTIQSYRVKFDLGYLKFTDSSWVKQADNWRIAILLDENESKSATHAYALNVNSQFLDTYKMIRRKDRGYVNEWRAGFFNPATVTFSYNLSLTVWKTSSILLGLSSLQFTRKPVYEGAKEPKEKPVARTKNSFIVLKYGMGGQVNIFSKKISGNVTWDNTSLFFGNSIGKDNVNFDFQNRFTFKFLKYMQFRVDTHVIYDPLYSYKLQYRQEFLVGVFFEKRK